jgi:2-polyprenyl-3-methyl-5-hydroxy-6-metoxy-1,4-benzoquinol methylase
MRLINHTFRRDIYERFALAMNHVSIQKPRSVLDVGCGSGQYSVSLAQLGVRRIVGVDLSRGMIELAVQKTSQVQNAAEILEFVTRDFMDFLPDEKFDLVIAMGFFDYIEYPLPVLQKMRSEANRSVIASFPSISILRTPIRKLRYRFKRCPVYFYKRDEITAMSEAAGFGNSEITKIKGAGMDYVAAFYM